MQADINTSQSIKVEQAIRNQIQKKLNKWKDYKNGLDATLTAIELGLSGGSILGAYSNWRKWETATSTTKRAVANFLQKAQLPMQVGGILIDGYMMLFRITTPLKLLGMLLVVRQELQELLM